MSMVTIIMATYNGEKFVGEQIDSILSSTYKEFELHIYDDGSKDSTRDILRQYEKLSPDKIKVFHNENNLGVILNFLQAVRRTTSDYIMLCDQDDVWKSDKIAITLNKMRKMEAQMGKDIPLAVFTDAIVVDQNLNILHNSFIKSGYLNPHKTDLPHLLMENKMIGCTTMMNAYLRKILHEHEIPRQARYHDWWIALIATAFGGIGYLDRGTLYYRQHGGNIVGNTSFLTYFKNRITTLKIQKDAINALQKQADDFLVIYGEVLSEEDKNMIGRFANLHNVNGIARRIQILRYGYLKTGVIRNIGLIFIV